MRMARKPSAVARELLRNFPKSGGKRRRRRPRREGSGGSNNKRGREREKLSEDEATAKDTDSGE
jgi:hypothetical protein